jgi:hypothetical protein
MTWPQVFLAQAKSDWQVYEHLKKTQFPSCHALHYLQMATEKLAKAYLLVRPTDVQSVLSTHKALIRFLRDVSRNNRLQNEMGMRAMQLRAHVQQLLPLAYEIENLAPSLAGDGPNPEYPWQDPTGAFHAPATYDFSITNALLEPHGYNLIKLVRAALKKFEILH